MSWLSSLLSAPETVSKTVDAVIKSGDALVFTPEEQSTANLKRLDWILKFHEASKGSNIARRIISTMFAAVFLLLILLAAGLGIFGATVQAAFVLKLLAETLVVPVGMIIGFYYASGIVRDNKDK